MAFRRPYGSDAPPLEGGYVVGTRLDPKHVAGIAPQLKKAFRGYGSTVGDNAYVVVTHGDVVQDVVELGRIDARVAGGAKHGYLPRAEMACLAVRPRVAEGEEQPAFPILEMIPKVFRPRDFADENEDAALSSLPPPSAEMLERARIEARHGTGAEAVAISAEEAVPGPFGKAVYFETTAAGRAAHFIRATRQDAGLSQAELAQKLEVAQSRVAELERGNGSQGPTLGLLERIVVACGRRLKLAIE